MLSVTTMFYDYVEAHLYLHCMFSDQLVPKAKYYLIYMYCTCGRRSKYCTATPKKKKSHIHSAPH